MNEQVKKHLAFLGYRHTLEHWDAILQEAKRKQPSYQSFFTDIIAREYADRKEKVRLSRVKRANIPDLLVMDTFPFDRQPRLKKRLVRELYDSFRFMTHRQELIFIGPTGCGKTGLATSFLVHAINQGYRGYFIEFGTLLARLFQARADHTEQKILKKLSSYDILLIDEMGYVVAEKEQAGLFFELIKARNKQHTTLITTQLGFDEWGGFLDNPHLTAAILDRITADCTVFNMKECISIRPKNIVYATKEKEQ
jgi:DNA replication protein DnaC